MKESQNASDEGLRLEIAPKIEWIKSRNPRKSGYFLATIQRVGSTVRKVVELWFDNGSRRWHTTAVCYLRKEVEAETVYEVNEASYVNEGWVVTAWSPMPYPSESSGAVRATPGLSTYSKPGGVLWSYEDGGHWVPIWCL